jgi:hypothetical protein
MTNTQSKILNSDLNDTINPSNFSKDSDANFSKSTNQGCTNFPTKINIPVKKPSSNTIKYIGEYKELHSPSKFLYKRGHMLKDSHMTFTTGQNLKIGQKMTIFSYEITQDQHGEINSNMAFEGL